MAELLKRLGVPASAISLEEKSLNTEGNAREVLLSRMQAHNTFFL